MGWKGCKHKKNKAKSTVAHVGNGFQMPMTALIPDDALSSLQLNRLNLKALTVTSSLILHFLL